MKPRTTMTINQLSALIILLISWIIYDAQLLECQAIKGGALSSSLATSTSASASASTKGGRQRSASSSSFKESIAHFRQVQQQQLVEQVRQQGEEVKAQVQEQVQVVAVGKDAAQQKAEEVSVYASVPRTKFTCSGKPHEPGMYADEEANCQAYHLCYEGRRESFLCGTGTMFNQANLNCDHSHQVDCTKSAAFYHMNADFGKASAEPVSKIRSKSRAATSRRRQQQQSVASTADKTSTQTTTTRNAASSLTASAVSGKTSAGSKTSSVRQSNVQSRTGSLKSPARVAHQQQLQLLQQQMESLSSDTISSSEQVPVGAGLQVEGTARLEAIAANLGQQPDGEWRPYFKSSAGKAASALIRPSTALSTSTTPSKPTSTSPSTSTPTRTTSSAAPITTRTTSGGRLSGEGETATTLASALADMTTTTRGDGSSVEYATEDAARNKSGEDNMDGGASSSE